MYDYGQGVGLRVRSAEWRVFLGILKVFTRVFTPIGLEAFIALSRHYSREN